MTTKQALTKAAKAAAKAAKKNRLSSTLDPSPRNGNGEEEIEEHKITSKASRTKSTGHVRRNSHNEIQQLTELNEQLKQKLNDAMVNVSKLKKQLEVEQEKQKETEMKYKADLDAKQSNPELKPTESESHNKRKSFFGRRQTGPSLFEKEKKVAALEEENKAYQIMLQKLAQEHELLVNMNRQLITQLRNVVAQNSSVKPEVLPPPPGKAPGAPPGPPPGAPLRKAPGAPPNTNNLNKIESHNQPSDPTTAPSCPTQEVPNEVPHIQLVKPEGHEMKNKEKIQGSSEVGVCGGLSVDSVHLIEQGCGAYGAGRGEAGGGGLSPKSGETNDKESNTEEDHSDEKKTERYETGEGEKEERETRDKVGRSDIVGRSERGDRSDKTKKGNSESQLEMCPSSVLPEGKKESDEGKRLIKRRQSMPPVRTMGWDHHRENDKKIVETDSERKEKEDEKKEDQSFQKWFHKKPKEKEKSREKKR
eukprot:TRINITY_DN13745_c0_g1_i2.p1 TRINITY_DN13745_c0_g1~~TRINITY_DN13745_c0_g1_i2.p1  ORF type:complete len:535 (-),score=164.62 TRINITY_DN13745_c0_g1_i2:15-1442(-)